MNDLQQPIAAPGHPAEITWEIASLNRRGPLASQGRFDVFLAAAWEIPSILHEIGRLREITFRAVGEGTGKALDLDPFDASYLHLFLWDREAGQVAGAYRLGCTDVLLAAGGPSALYTSTLFDFEEPFLDYLRPALELGRSFVAPDYQKSIHPLGLLWRGIGRFVAERPRYGRLFGPVSISREYTAYSQDLIVRFLRDSKQDRTVSGWVRPRHPYGGLPAEDGISQRLQSIEEVSAAVSAAEPDKKGVPVLLRQYLKLNATLLEFNVDPDFSDVLDALVLVDLRQAPATVLTRYMGEDGYRAFTEAAVPRVA
ncbi:GNAT family N-acetyltransferase [Luteolibacter flavescens]|uniref:GNAT family N-acetyltransferase n=1 Tax=Luteolibacter flavescens TaxID=1859460 RepID=A0ABT3FP82_9BACT|nr:GNAT family N-acetyltransferase [Luteolibacter flavescens]MCW1885387.1 GNAT family N-acetyltransferase [Luteolibacter flavescens]